MKVLVVGEQALKIEQVVAVAQNQCLVALPTSQQWQNLIQRGADFLDQLLEEEGVIYGVTTGYGDSCLVEIPPHQV
ncbi:MAG: aromatic amino acid lyase, partial [Acinetobacter sp.]|uniref:aromatic amino acid lyase n=1 Tax=Acinetobacter sp. TaxID=472 RepID=UPI002FC7CE5A